MSGAMRAITGAALMLMASALAGYTVLGLRGLVVAACAWVFCGGWMLARGAGEGR